MSEMEIDLKLKGSTITDVEYHQDTGELLTVWVRNPEGKLISLIPEGYRIASIECPWSERFHGGKVPLKQSQIKNVKPIKPDGYASELSGNWDDVPEWAVRRINFLEETIEWNDKMRCPRMNEVCPDYMFSCRTIKHCYPHLCNGVCGHNEIWVSDEEKQHLERIRFYKGSFG